ncbi:hypothetical protein PO909_002767 [Leuciscus waleckii]
MIDGDTDISNKECIYAATKKAFASLGRKCENWLEKVIALGADGAAVNLDHKGGVIALLHAEFEHAPKTREGWRPPELWTVCCSIYAHGPPGWCLSQCRHSWQSKEG